MVKRKKLVIPKESNWILIQDYTSCKNYQYYALVMCTLCFNIMEISRNNILHGKSKQCKRCGRKIGASKRKVDKLILPKDSNFELIEEYSSFKECHTSRGEIIKTWKSKVRCKLCGDILEVRRQNLKSGKTLQCNSCSRKGKNHHSYGRKEEFRENISKTMRENPERQAGYIDGRCSLEKKIRKHYRYVDWRNAVYERDNYTCQATGETNCRLAAHHIIPLEYIIKNNNLKTIDDAINCEELWDLNNGITYSAAYHIKYHLNNK